MVPSCQGVFVLGFTGVVYTCLPERWKYYALDYAALRPGRHMDGFLIDRVDNCRQLGECSSLLIYHGMPLPTFAVALIGQLFLHRGTPGHAEMLHTEPAERG